MWAELRDLRENIDFGTPPRNGAEVTITVDGEPVKVPSGSSVMLAAAKAGKNLPKLCATDTLEPFGSCRLCLVEIEGMRGYPASCTTLVEEGMAVTTQSDKLQALRKGVLELYLSDFPEQDIEGGWSEFHNTLQQCGVTTHPYGQGDNHQDTPVDESNPYFLFDPAKCIVCSRCVRACEEIQGTFALTISARGFESEVAAGPNHSFFESECVSCGACVQTCPTQALVEKAYLKEGTNVANPIKPDRSVVTTCAYCGVGCSFKAETYQGKIVRMIPWKEGKANHGHSCVKGRFAYDYYNHPDRIRTPLIRKSIEDPWQEVSWDEAINYAASEFKRIQDKHGKKSIGGVSSSRCTNEEIFLVQKLVRAVMGNNNIDNCARICHSPTQFGMSATVGWGAASQHFDSILQANVIMVVGANPTEGHPVFGSLMKRRIREGAKLIVIDPRRTETVDSAHCKATLHLALRPGTNVAVLDSISHVIVREKLYNEQFIRARCEWEEFEVWMGLVGSDRYAPEVIGPQAGIDPEAIRQVARMYAGGPNSAIYYGLGVTEHSQGSTGVMCLGNLALACGMLGREGVGVNPLRGQGNVQGGSCLGSWPHVFSGYRFVTDPEVRSSFEGDWGVPLDDEPGLRLPNMFDAALSGHFRGMFIMGEDPVQSDPNQHHVIAAMKSMECVVLQDIFLNETAKYAHVLLPGSSSLEKEGSFTSAERRVNRVRKVVEPLAGYQDWEIVVKLMNAMGYPAHYNNAGEILDEIARLSPAYKGMSFELLDRIGSAQWPCDENAPEGTEVLHTVKFPRANGRGTFMLTEYVPTIERTNDRYPLLLTTGRILSQYNVGTQTRRTANSMWHPEDVLEINAEDAHVRGIHDGDWLNISSRFGTTQLKAKLSKRVNPGIVYTTFHHAKSKANVLTSDLSDWATNCPEYKVTAVEVVKTDIETVASRKLEALEETNA